MNKQIEESKSIEELIKLIDDNKVVLPEFQRDFKWPIEKTEVLFDSIFKGLFIGSLILSKPKFDLACKSLDLRPRGSKKHKPKAKIYKESDFENRNIMALLDGQQRITSIYRALKGPDQVFVQLKPLKFLFDENNYDYLNLEPKIKAEEYVEGFFTDDPPSNSFYLSLSDLYQMIGKREKIFLENCVNPRINEIDVEFSDNQIEALHSYSLNLLQFFNISIVNESNLLSVQLLEMDLEKFCLYFERSNSQGLNLTFIDIITAKVYVDFKLSNAINKAVNKYNYFNDKLIEPVVRYLNFISNGEVTRKSILKDLNSETFVDHWDSVVKDVSFIQEWMLDQNMIFSADSIPYRTMLLPLLSFYQNLPNKDFTQASTEQLDILKLWFYASIFDTRYGGARHGSTNVVIKDDCNTLKNLAKNKFPSKEYWDKLRIEFSFNELKKITSNNSAKQIAIQYLMYSDKPFLNFENDSKVTFGGKIDVHHIFPSNYLKSKFGSDSDEYDISDTILNKVFIHKIPNIKYSDKKPSDYLSEIKNMNPKLITSLESHGIPNPDMLISGEYDNNIFKFLEDRYKMYESKLSLLREKLKSYQSNE